MNDETISDVYKEYLATEKLPDSKITIERMAVLFTERQAIKEQIIRIGKARWTNL